MAYRRKLLVFKVKGRKFQSDVTIFFSDRQHKLDVADNSELEKVNKQSSEIVPSDILSTTFCFNVTE